MGVKLERTHPLLSLTQTDLGWSFPKIFDAKRTPGCQRGTFLGETRPPFASVQMAWPPPPPALISHSKGSWMQCIWPKATRVSGLPRCLHGEESSCQFRSHRRRRFDPWAGKIPWRRRCQPTPVFLPGKPPTWRSLVGYSPITATTT